MGICPFAGKNAHDQFIQCQGPDCQLWAKGKKISKIDPYGTPYMEVYNDGCGLAPKENRKAWKV
jgi:hypothetical protein